MLGCGLQGKVPGANAAGELRSPSVCSPGYDQAAPIPSFQRVVQRSRLRPKDCAHPAHPLKGRLTLGNKSRVKAG